VYSNFGLTKLQYIVRKLCSDKRRKAQSELTQQANNLRENNIYNNNDDEDGSNNKKIPPVLSVPP